MIDVDREKLITMAEGARQVPGRPNLTTLWRWRNRGVCGVKLEVCCVGGRTYTSTEALSRFLERVTAAKNGQPMPECDSRQRETDKRAARKTLVKAGLID